MRTQEQLKYSACAFNALISNRSLWGQHQIFEYIIYSYLRVNAKLYRTCERCSCRSFICVQIFIRVTSCYTQYVLLSKIRASIFILMHIVIAFCDFIFTLCTICYALNSTHQFWFHSFIRGAKEWCASSMILNSLLIPLISK